MIVEKTLHRSILVLNAFCDKRKKHIDCTFEYIDSYSFAIDVDDVSSMKEQKNSLKTF